tara:strand:+ start:2142 stop:3635 length:1494 start_codon:yes stop_codon:yes gene_type:complete
MPTQLKIIADEYSPNSSFTVGTSAPFTVNFQAPVVISPGQKIAMDKFAAVIPDITANFALDQSTFTLWYCLNGDNNQSSPVIVPAGKYSSLAQLLNVMTKLSNNVFTSFNANTLPVDAQGNYNYYREQGLKMQCSGSSGKFFMEYVTCPFPKLVLNPVGLSTTSDNYLIPSGVGNWTLSQSDSTVVLTKGGGCLLEFQIIVPEPEFAIADGAQFYCGLNNDKGGFLGLHQDLNGILYLRNIDGVLSSSLNITNYFPEGTICQFYQVNGYFQLRTFTIDQDDLEITHFDTETSNGGAFSQSLGAIDYDRSYNFYAYGSKTADQYTTVPAIGANIEMTKDIPFGATQNQFTRTVGIDFTLSNSLRAGLGLSDGLLLFTPQNSDFGAFLGNSPMNLSKINSSFDLALEILDLPLQTFQGNSSRNQLGSRQNVVCYFRPEHSNVGTNTYIYDSLAYQWLDIAISYPVNLSSLSFRVYNPYTGQNLVADNLTFNLMISDLAY